MPVALPQITISGPGLNFGGPGGFPSGREVTTTAFGDTATYLRGNHIIKFGGEFRRRQAQQLQRRSRHLHLPERGGVSAGIRQRVRDHARRPHLQRLRERDRRIRAGLDHARTEPEAGSRPALRLAAVADRRQRQARHVRSGDVVADPHRLERLHAGDEERQRLPAARRRHLEPDRRRQAGRARRLRRDGEPEQHRLLRRRGQQSAAHHAAVRAGGGHGGEQHQARQRADRRGRGGLERRRSPTRISCRAGCRRGTSTSSARSAGRA